MRILAAAVYFEFIEVKSLKKSHTHTPLHANAHAHKYAGWKNCAAVYLKRHKIELNIIYDGKLRLPQSVFVYP